MTPLHLIAYDIADPRRLGRVHRFLKRIALPLQYSVFLAQCSPQDLAATAQSLRALMDERRDDIRIYRLPEACRARFLGRPILPPGALLAAHPTLDQLQPRALQLPPRKPNFSPSPAAIPGRIMP